MLERLMEIQFASLCLVNHHSIVANTKNEYLSLYFLLVAVKTFTPLNI